MKPEDFAHLLVLLAETAEDMSWSDIGELIPTFIEETEFAGDNED